MKILQVANGFPPKRRAGTEIYTYHLSRELAKKCEVHVFYPARDEVEKSITLRSFEWEDLYLHELVMPTTNRIRGLWSLLFFENTYINKNVEKIFRKLLKEIRPDIVHFQHLIGLSVTLIDVTKEYKIPTVLTLHDYWFICPNIQLLKYNYTICEGPEPNKCRECWIKKRAKGLSEAIEGLWGLILRIFNSPWKFEKRHEYLKSLLLKVDKIVAPSRFLREMFIKYGIPMDKIVYSENGYNLDVFKGFKKKEKNTNKIIFGFVGGIAKHKGVHVLIDAFMHVPEDKAELRIYGSYNPSSKYVKELLEKTKNKKNIKFVGRFEDVKDPYSEIDVLVFSSIWYENCPLVLAEARATRTPVIASNLGAIPEFVEDGKTGLLFEPNNPKDLYEKIMYIIGNSELIEKFKTNIRPPKSIREQTRELEKIYRSLIRSELQ